MPSTAALEKRVLLYAPLGRDARLAAEVFGSAQLEGAICHGIDDLLAELQAGAGALLIMEEALRGEAFGRLAGYVAAQPTWSDLPVLLMTRSGGESAGLREVTEALGNVTLLERPIRTSTLLSAVKAALRARTRQYQVREADRRKDEFLASLSHELRNPLAPVRTSMMVLRRLHPESAGAGQVCDVVERQVAYLARLVDDLLDVARITSSKVTLKRELVPLSVIVANAVEVGKPLADAGGHALIVSQPAEPVFLDVDPVRVVQSLTNVLANAAKYTLVPGRIELQASVEGGEAVFAVADDGIGISAQALPQIFEMFVQNPLLPGQSQAGLGVGLALARRFVEMHGGRIEASSAGPGQGSRFELRLPVLAASPAAAPAGGPAESIEGGNRLVLVVDDNRDGADMLQMLLEAEGFEVKTAYDGREAVAKAEQLRPDIIVMDIGMPGMDGNEAAQRIRSQEGGKDILIVALTGWGQDSAKQRTAEAGFDHHLVKPVDFAELRRFLETDALRHG